MVQGKGGGSPGKTPIEMISEKVISEKLPDHVAKELGGNLNLGYLKVRDKQIEIWTASINGEEDLENGKSRICWWALMAKPFAMMFAFMKTEAEMKEKFPSLSPEVCKERDALYHQVVKNLLGSQSSFLWFDVFGSQYAREPYILALALYNDVRLNSGIKKSLKLEGKEDPLIKEKEIEFAKDYAFTLYHAADPTRSEVNEIIGKLEFLKRVENIDKEIENLVEELKKPKIEPIQNPPENPPGI